MSTKINIEEIAEQFEEIITDRFSEQEDMLKHYIFNYVFNPLFDSINEILGYCNDLKNEIHQLREDLSAYRDKRILEKSNYSEYD